MYKACTKKLEETVSDTATKKLIRANRMRYAFVWIFLTMNGLEEPFSEYSSRIRDAIVNAKDRKDPRVSQELMQACNAYYARHPICSTTRPAPLSLTSMQVKCSLNIVFDEDAQSYQISPANPNEQDPMLNIAPCLLEVGASGTCIDEMKLLLQTPWTLDRSASSTVFLRGVHADVVNVRVDKSAELYGRRHEILIPWKLREFLKNNKPAGQCRDTQPFELTDPSSQT